MIESLIPTYKYQWRETSNSYFDREKNATVWNDEWMVNCQHKKTAEELDRLWSIYDQKNNFSSFLEFLNGGAKKHGWLDEPEFEIIKMPKPFQINDVGAVYYIKKQWVLYGNEFVQA